MRVQADDNAVALVKIVVHVFDLISIHVGCCRFNRRRQVINNFALWRWLPYLGHGVADFECKVRLRSAKHFG